MEAYECGVRLENALTRNSTSSVMVWGCVAYHVVGELVIVKESVNARVYVDILESNLFQSVENIYGDRETPIVFQHDNAPAHTARLTQRWLDDNDVRAIQ